jgi:hypothetical protein
MTVERMLTAANPSLLVFCGCRSEAGVDGAPADA